MNETQYFATARWMPKDIMEMFAVTEQEATDWLDAIEHKLRDHMVHEGWMWIMDVADSDGLPELPDLACGCSRIPYEWCHKCNQCYGCCECQDD